MGWCASCQTQVQSTHQAGSWHQGEMFAASPGCSVADRYPQCPCTLWMTTAQSLHFCCSVLWKEEPTFHCNWRLNNAFRVRSLLRRRKSQKSYIHNSIYLLCNEVTMQLPKWWFKWILRIKWRKKSSTMKETLCVSSNFTELSYGAQI